MHLNSAQIEQALIVWVLIANGAKAQIYRYHKNKNIMPMNDPKRQPYDQEIKRHELTPVPGMALQAESLNDFQVGHDGRGSLIGGNSAHNTCEPHLDIRDEVKQNLVTEIIAKLKQANEKKDFDQLVIAASPKILGLLRQHMTADILSKVTAEIARDFTNDGTHALLDHLQETLTEACMA